MRASTVRERSWSWCGLSNLLYSVQQPVASLGVEKYSDIVGGEGTFPGGRASSDYGLMILAGAETALELARNGVEAGCGVTHDEPGLTGTCVASAHSASLTGVVCGFRYKHSGFCDDAGNGALLLVESKDWNGAGEVFDGVELIVTCNDSDSDGVDVGIEQIGAVAGGVHPEIMDDHGAWSFAYIF